MTQQVASRYEFERLPLSPVDPGTNVLVAGPSLSGARRLLLEMLADGGDDEGVLLVSADLSGHEAVRAFEETGSAFDTGRMCVIDCSQQGSETDGTIRQVGSPSDLTGIGIEFSSLYESLRGRDRPLIRVGLYSVSTLLVYADDFRAVYRFLHTITSRIRTADGLGVAAIDPEATDDEALGTVTQAFDARIDVRNGDDGPEIKVRGLPDQPNGWLPIPQR